MIGQEMSCTYVRTLSISVPSTWEERLASHHHHHYHSALHPLLVDPVKPVFLGGSHLQNAVESQHPIDYLLQRKELRTMSAFSSGASFFVFFLYPCDRTKQISIKLWEIFAMNGQVNKYKISLNISCCSFLLHECTTLARGMQKLTFWCSSIYFGDFLKRPTVSISLAGVIIKLSTSFFIFY